VRELQIDSENIDEIVGRRIVGFEEKRGRTSGTKCEWNAFVRFQFDTTNNVEDDDEEGETVALETTSVTARITQKWVRSW
jgi:CobQ-like glutamine amidotransferase family enzyme